MQNPTSQITEIGQSPRLCPSHALIHDHVAGIDPVASILPKRLSGVLHKCSVHDWYVHIASSGDAFDGILEAPVGWLRSPKGVVPRGKWPEGYNTAREDSSLGLILLRFFYIRT